MPPHALITGGAGFVGSHLAEALCAAGWAVTVLDDLSTGRRENLDGLEEQGRGRLTFVEGSAADEATVGPLIEQATHVFHLASAVGVRLIVEKPVHTIEATVATTACVLRAAGKHGTPVLLTSSSEVYGKGSRIPFAEDDDVVLGPTSKRRWAHACGKMLDEFLALAHWYEQGLPVVIARLFNTVGPRQTGRYGMVLPTFVQQALRGEALTVFGDGTQTRCFCHVRDVVDALVRLIDCEAARGRVINLGSTEETSIADLARRVIGRVGSTSQVELVPYDEAYVEGFEDMARRVPDTTLARSLVGFAPQCGLDAIIGEIAAAMRSCDS